MMRFKLVLLRASIEKSGWGQMKKTLRKQKLKIQDEYFLKNFLLDLISQIYSVFSQLSKSLVGSERI